MKYVYTLTTLAVYFSALTMQFSVNAAGISGTFAGLWRHALRHALSEQLVEDKNNFYKMNGFLARRLIVMPMSHEFNPGSYSPMHGKIQHSDKCSLPSSLGKELIQKPYEVPWIFEVSRESRLEATTAKNSEGTTSQENEIRDSTNLKKYSLRERGNTSTPLILPKAYVSPLDFRAPENFIFVPKWVMTSLNLTTGDTVSVSLLRLKLASLVVLQPTDKSWDNLLKIASGGDPTELLEQEINKYSALTAGSNISIEVKGVVCSFYIKQTISESGVPVYGVRVQDSDVKVEIDRSLIDKIVSK